MSSNETVNDDSDGAHLTSFGIEFQTEEEAKENERSPSVALVLLYIMLAYLMLFAALHNAVCLYNSSLFFFSAIDFCKCFLFSCFVLVY